MLRAVQKRAFTRFFAVDAHMQHSEHHHGVPVCTSPVATARTYLQPPPASHFRCALCCLSALTRTPALWCRAAKHKLQQGLHRSGRRLAVSAASQDQVPDMDRFEARSAASSGAHLLRCTIRLSTRSKLTSLWPGNFVQADRRVGALHEPNVYNHYAVPPLLNMHCSRLISQSRDLSAE